MAGIPLVTISRRRQNNYTFVPFASLSQKFWPMKTSRFHVFRLIFQISLAILVWHRVKNHSLPTIPVQQRTEVDDSISSNGESTKVVLYWTKWWRRKFCWDCDVTREQFEEKCSETFGRLGLSEDERRHASNCVFTDDRDRDLKRADAVIFHMPDFYGVTSWPFEAVDIPQERFAHQRYVFYTMEPPVYALNNYRDLDGFFNWTMTYRLDSDIPSFYGETFARQTPSITPEPSPILRDKNIWVAWAVSRCNSHSKREILARQLGKYIPVRVFGGCGETWTSETPQLIQSAKFYLSFENSICHDYVTEKFFAQLSGGHSIPVVLGGANYTKFAPPNSFIDAQNFTSPQELARFLLKVGSDQALYDSFFAWRTAFWVDRTFSNFCNLCRILNGVRTESKKFHRRSYKIREWWSISPKTGEPACRAYEPNHRMDVLPSNRLEFASNFWV